MVGQLEVLSPAQMVPDGAARGGSESESGQDTAARLREVDPIVRRICRSRLGGIDGDEAAQRVMVRLWRALEDGREFESLAAYAATCARFSVVESRRDERRLPTPSELAEQTWADEGPGPEEHVERADAVAHARQRVAALLAQLTPRQAEVMRASVLAERSNKDAAELLGMTPDSVRTKQARAMARLRELCGTTSPNPLALNLSSAEREKRKWTAEKARRAARRAEPALSRGAIADAATADAVGGRAPDLADGRTDPMDVARIAVDALDGGAGADPRGDGGGTTDPLVRARVSVDALRAATDRGDAVEDGAAPAERDQSIGAAAEFSSDGFGFGAAEHDADTAGVA